MPENSSDILARFQRDHARVNSTDINLTLRPAYLDLLMRLGNPQNSMPPVFHVAGTNGKGSTCAFLRAVLEAVGYRVHVYTSPHLISFHERIRLAGQLIDEAELIDVLQTCAYYINAGQVSLFEATTAAAFLAFSRTPADFTIIETGLGGRLDATNVVAHPIATLITRLSYDHREYLGDTITQIAREKAGIMRAGVPCFAAFQPDAEASNTLHQCANTIGAPLVMGGRDWQVEKTSSGFHFHDKVRDLVCPPPSLLGDHQIQNAGLAIAALAALPTPIVGRAIIDGVQNAEWPARLQRLNSGTLYQTLPTGAELWLDGGHNDSAGEVLAQQVTAWRKTDGASPRPLRVIVGMIASKSPAEFLSPLRDMISVLHTITIPDEPQSRGPEETASLLREAGFEQAIPASSLHEALRHTQSGERVLICGSLYLAGYVLKTNSATVT